MANLFSFSKIYWQLGLNVVCCKNEINENNFWSNNILKCPYHDYTHLKYSRQSMDELKSYDWDDVATIGIACGYEDLMVIDIDDCFDNDLIFKMLNDLKLPKNYQWLVRSGSHAGYHIPFYFDKVAIDEIWLKDFYGAYQPSTLYTNKFSKIEFLNTWCFITPPSIHTAGSYYEFLFCTVPRGRPSKINSQTIANFILKYTDVIKSEVTSLPPGQTKNLYKIRRPIDGASPFTDYQAIDFHSNDIGKSYKEKNRLYMVIDIETDGLIEGDKIPNILQAAWNIYDFRGVLKMRKSFLVNSKINEAININNLDPNILEDFGRNILDVLKSLFSDLDYVTTVVAHNIHFEWKILDHYFSKYALVNAFEGKTLICTMKGSTNYLYNENIIDSKKYLKLIESYEAFFGNQDEIKTHNALHDVIVTQRIFQHIYQEDTFDTSENCYEKSRWPFIIEPEYDN